MPAAESTKVASQGSSVKETTQLSRCVFIRKHLTGARHSFRGKYWQRYVVWNATTVYIALFQFRIITRAWFMGRRFSIFSFPVRRVRPIRKRKRTVSRMNSKLKRSNLCYILKDWTSWEAVKGKRRCRRRCGERRLTQGERKRKWIR